MTNSHGLDVDYFSRKMERMINGAASYTRSEWARECARMARVADAAVLLEDEFVGDLRKNAELHSEIQRAAGELPGAWSIEIMVERHCGAVSLFDDDGNEVEFDGQGPLSEQVSDALALALSQEVTP